MSKPTPESIAIGETLEFVILFRKYKQMQLAAKCSISDSDISKIKHGTRVLTFQEAIKICECLNFPIQNFAAIVALKIYPELKVKSLSECLFDFILNSKQFDFATDEFKNLVKTLIEKIDEYYSQPKNF